MSPKMRLSLLLEVCRQSKLRGGRGLCRLIRNLNRPVNHFVHLDWRKQAVKLSNLKAPLRDAIEICQQEAF